MLFNSLIFWVFFAVVACAYYGRRTLRWQNRLLLVASYVFYSAWDWRFLSLILISTGVDFLVAKRLGQLRAPAPAGSRPAKVLLGLSLGLNLGMLGVFKYFKFFAAELAQLLDRVGIASDLTLLEVVLPVGISFYTFQTLSYTIDVYRGHTTPTDNLLDFALYVAFFPQLVAGPIERSSRLLPQILNPRPQGDFQEGLYHVVTGLFKKVFIADNLAPLVNSIFSQPPEQLTGPEVLVGVYAFAFQIYGDFSGYSSIARGVAKWLGFDLMVNFSLPYFARSPSDFWKRWHISLSSWLRDYLYIPLGGNRGGGLSTYRNLLLTMLLGGLWHGAGWNFIAWGALHGVLLCAYRPFERSVSATPPPSKRRSALRALQVFVFFHFVCLGWLLFRASSLDQAWQLAARIFSQAAVTEFALAGACLIAFHTLPLLLYEAWLYKRRDLLALLDCHWLIQALVYAYCGLSMLFFSPSGQHEFIYFRF